MPRMVLRVEPVVSERQIKWSMITSPIEARIREVVRPLSLPRFPPNTSQVLESIVLPHMDDLPFFNSSPFLHRGGIWGDALRTPHDLSTPTGGSGDEAHAIGKDELVDDEEVAGTGMSTGREESGTRGASLARRRRSSDGDTSAEAFSNEGSGAALTKSAASGSSSLSSFSLWRESRGRENGGAEKRKSWFAPKSGASTPPNRSETGSGEEASRLRDVLKKRARSRERERAAAASGGASTKSLSGLSMTAPKAGEGGPGEASRSTPVLGLDDASERSVRMDYDSDSTSLIAPLTDSPMASVTDLLLKPATLIEPSTRSAPSDSLPVPASPITSQPTSIPPTLPSRPSFTKFLPAPAPSRPSHQASQSADAGSSFTSAATTGSSFASAATTASLLAAWRTKASDKQAIAAGVAQAKDTMKRWGANWNARRAGEGEAETNGSPRQDVGRDGEGEGESYRDYRAGKERNGEYYPSAEASAPISFGEESTSKHRRAESASVRRTSGSTSPSGHFSPAAPAATTKLSTPAVSSTYRPATRMAIPGIREEKKRIEVAGDHVSAEEGAKSVEEHPPSTPPTRYVAPTSPTSTTPVAPSSTDTPLPSAIPSTPATNGIPPTLPPRQAPSTEAPSSLPTTLSNPATLSNPTTLSTPALTLRAAPPVTSASRRVPPPPTEPSKLVAFQPPPPVPSRPSAMESAGPPPVVPARPVVVEREELVMAGEGEGGLERTEKGVEEDGDGEKDGLGNVADEAGWGLEEEIEVGEEEGSTTTTT